MSFSFEEKLVSPLCTFVVGEEKKEVLVHSGALANLSPSFNELINGPMIESLTKKVLFPDVSVGAFMRLCEYAYTRNYKPPNPSFAPGTSRCDGKDIDCIFTLTSHISQDTKAIADAKHRFQAMGNQSGFLVNDRDGTASWNAASTTQPGLFRTHPAASTSGNTTSTTQPNLFGTLPAASSPFRSPVYVPPPSNFRDIAAASSSGKSSFLFGTTKEPEQTPSEKEYAELCATFESCAKLNTPRHSDFEPKMNLKPSDNFTPVFLGHAELYILADQYQITDLRTLVFEKLYKTLKIFTMYESRIEDLMELIRFTYQNTTPRDQLRKMIMSYIACGLKHLTKRSEFKELLAEGGDFPGEFLEMISDRFA